MLLDIGGCQYRDLDTDERYFDVIAEKISPEFADIIRKMLDVTNADFEDLKDEVEFFKHADESRYEGIQEIRNLARDAAAAIKSMKRLDRNYIIFTFEEIEDEAENWL